MSEVKAIETRYQGYRFRSRLEARWAVFFDALGITWEYEPEGFVLPDGTQYLPDFYLPGMEIWVEVKPKRDNGTFFRDFQKMFDFVGATEKRGMCAWGVPDANLFVIIQKTKEIGADFKERIRGLFEQGIIPYEVAASLDRVDGIAGISCVKEEGQDDRIIHYYQALFSEEKQAEISNLVKSIKPWVLPHLPTHINAATACYGEITRLEDFCDWYIHTAKDLKGLSDPTSPEHDDVWSAISCAKSARFEFGQQGAG